MRDDDSGQFILLMSVLVAIGLVIILIFLNQSFMAGHSSAQSIMDFPKDDIRDFNYVTVNEARDLGTSVNAGINGTPPNQSLTAFNDSFNASFDPFIVQLKDTFARQGTSVEVNYTACIRDVNISGNRTLHMGDNVTVYLYYNNGETAYDSNKTIYLM